MKLYNNIFVILLLIFITFSIFFTLIVKPQFLNMDIKNCKKYENFLNKNKEKFSNISNDIDVLNNITLNSYKNGFSFNNPPVQNYKQFIDKYDVYNNEPLLTYMCVKNTLTSEDDMHDLQIMIDTLSSSFYVSVIDTYVINSTDIITKISENFDDTIRKTGELKLKCPIYALIYQSPYLRYNDEEIYAKYDVVNNLKSSYSQTDNNSPDIGSKSLYTKIIMLYPNYIEYNKSGTIIKISDNSGINAFQKYFNDSIASRDKLCFMECNKYSKIACGCLNKNIKDSGNENEYKSSCLDKNDKPTNYGMLYTVNSYYPPYVSKIYMVEGADESISMPL